MKVFDYVIRFCRFHFNNDKSEWRNITKEMFFNSDKVPQSAYRQSITEQLVKVLGNDIDVNIDFNKRSVKVVLKSGDVEKPIIEFYRWGDFAMFID